jgi:transposase InsO family protein
MIVLCNHRKNVPITQSCAFLGYARSSFYKAHVFEKKKVEFHSVLLEKIYNIRQEMPALGGGKLHFLLRKTLLESGHTSIGRDSLFTLLRERNMLVERKRKYAITTNSNHPFKIYTNLILGNVIVRKNQAWVSDITYVRTKSGFCYVSLITDMYSRKIVGYHASTSLELEGCVKALKMALKSGKPEIHHSDRGSQYCSHIYTNIVKKNGAKISMAAAGNCYENALAERINGILKHEFNLNATFDNLKQVRKTLEQAVQVYNVKRPNWALKFEFPENIYNAA